MENEKIIVFDKVCKTFKTRHQTIEAVRDYNMEIEKGELVSILGPSGCGKSTIIRMMDGIIKPSSGNIFIEGINVSGLSRMPSEVLRKMGFIFQQANMLPWFTVCENVSLPLKVFGLRGKEWNENVTQLMNMAGLSSVANEYPTQVSLGKRQLAGVIRAMVYNPDILLMDEPFASLDDMSREQMDIELLEIWSKTNKTIIFITHSVNEAVLLSDRIYVMATNPGRLTDVVEIDLPRPRTLDMMATPVFIAYEHKITKLIGELDLSKIK